MATIPLAERPCDVALLGPVGPGTVAHRLTYAYPPKDEDGTPTLGLSRPGGYPWPACVEQPDWTDVPRHYAIHSAGIAASRGAVACTDRRCWS